jgi:hypothetical protein
MRTSKSVPVAAVVVISLLLLGAGVAAVSQADEETIATSDLPAAVTDKLNELYPDAEILEAEKETEDGRTVYEVELKTGGKTIEVEFDADGTVLETEEETGDDD